MIRMLGMSFLALVIAAVIGLADDSPVLTGAYLGQTPPGRFPRLFAPGIVSVRANFEHSAAVFSPDGSEVFWVTNVNRITDPPGEGLRLYFMRRVDGIWTAPEIAPFALDFTQPVERPCFSPDGTKLYFETSRIPDRESDADIYVVERRGDGWSEPTPVSPLINTTAIERIHCITADGSMIFTRNLMTPREAVYISHFVDGAFTEPEELGEDFNSEAIELAIALSADESYALFATSRTGREDELYVSYKMPDGSWSERVKAPYSCGGFLALSPDEEYVFFLGEGIFWVDASFVEELKPEHLR